MSRIHAVPLTSWTGSISPAESDALCARLEQGDVLAFPQLPFVLRPDEERFLTQSLCEAGTKNVSYRAGTKEVRGTRASESDREGLRGMLERYATSAMSLVRQVLPRYVPHCVDKSTSYRPAPIDKERLGWHRDDTRLHVDAFRATPSGGRRLLRVFSNVHPGDAPRRWLVGERFDAYAAHFVPRLKPPIPGSAHVLRALGLTRGIRTRYDHFMLQLHDLAKLDEAYQRDAPRERVDFLPGTTWIVFTDQVVHAATEGQFAFEQTFFLDPAALAHPAASPLAILESLTGRRLVRH